MLLQITFGLMLIVSCCYAAYAGGQAGRYCALLFFGAAILSMIPNEQSRFQSTVLFVFGIDFLCLTSLVILAMHYRHGWLIWCAGLQLAGLATHFATIVAPHFSPIVYQALHEFWSIPILLVMVAGITLHRQRQYQ
jgi:hypothetical protein